MSSRSNQKTPPFVPPHYHHHQDDPQRHRSISFPITMIQCSSLCCFSLLINITIGVAKDNPMLVLVGRVGAPIGACWCLSEDSSQGRQHRGFHSFSGQHHRHCHHPYHQCHHYHHHQHHDHHHIIIAIVIIILTMRMNMPSLLSCHHCIVLLSSRTL